MAFPFWWVGGLVAALFLGAAFLLFVLLDRILTGTVDNIRSSALPGLVAGIRTWTTPSEPPVAVSPAGERLEELPGPGSEAMERVHTGR